MHIQDGMTVQQKAGEKVAPIDFPGNFSPIRAASHPRYTNDDAATLDEAKAQFEAAWHSER